MSTLTRPKPFKAQNFSRKSSKLKLLTKKRLKFNKPSSLTPNLLNKIKLKKYPNNPHKICNKLTSIIIPPTKINFFKTNKFLSFLENISPIIPKKNPPIMSNELV